MSWSRLQYLLARMKARIGWGLCMDKLGCSTKQQEPRQWVGHSRLGQSTRQHVQNLGLGMGLVGELGLLPCYAAAPTIECENQQTVGRLGWARLQHLLAYIWVGPDGRPDYSRL